MRVVIAGAGFGGLELATRLSEEFGDEADVVLIDRADGFVFGFSKLDVMFSRATAEHVLHRYVDVAGPGVQFVRSTIRVIDPVARTVVTDDGTFEADVLVVALGADLDPAATPGLVEGGYEFYTVAGAFAARDALAQFGGGRIVIGVTSTPFKCPPAPSETALLSHLFLRDRGLLESSHVSLVMPFGVPIPPSPDASQAVLAAFAERDIAWHPGQLVVRLEPDRKVAVSSGGKVFAYGQAPVVAAHISAHVRGVAPSVTYAGRGICYLDFGHDTIAKVDVTFLSGQRAAGLREGPSIDLAADKVAFGSERIRRWFHRTWAP